MAVVLLLAMAGIVGAPTKVEALGDGSLSGTVTGAQGEPLPGTFIGVNNSNFALIAQAVTDAAGHYSLSQLPNNESLSVFVAPDFNSPYPVKSISGVVLGPAESRVLDVQLSLASSVSGHVVTADGSAVNGSVSLYEINTGAQAGAQIINGAFLVSNIISGTWVVFAASGQGAGDPYAPEYFGGSYTLADATPVAITDGAQVTGIDITLDIGATVTGQVLDEQGSPAPNAFADIASMNGPPGSFTYQRFGIMQADSRFVFVGLPPGTFSVSASADAVTGLGRTIRPVTVALGDALTGVDIPLQRGVFGVVRLRDASGPVTAGTPRGFPVVCDQAAVVVNPFDLCGNFPLEHLVPNPTGDGWIVGPLAPGDFQARGLFSNTFGPSASLHPVAGGGFTCDLPAPGLGAAECVEAPAVATGSVSGRVVDVGGFGVPGVEVRAWVLSGSDHSTIPTRTFTDSTGEYVLPNVFVGSVQIQFLAPPARLDLQSSWWSPTGSTTAESAAGLITVSDGATTAGIDGTLPSVASGHITLTRSGVPLTSGFGLTATFCSAPSALIPNTLRCSDGTAPITVGINSLPLPLVKILPGTYNLQSFEFSISGPRSGAPILLQLAGGDEFDCTLPVEPTGVPSCTVNGNAPDSTPPSIDGQVAPALPDGELGWWRTDVSVDWTVSEPESPNSLVTVGCQDVIITGDTTGELSTCSASSDGGSAGPAQLFVRRDATPPTLAWLGGFVDGQVLPIGHVPAVSCGAQDTTSGPSGCVVSGWSDQPGTHTLTAIASDNAGNTTTETRSYTVTTPYTLKGFYAPVRMDSVNRVSDGSEVELRFEVFSGATEVRDPTVVGSFTATPVSCTTGAVAGPATDVLGGRTLRYDARKGVFNTEWRVPKRARGCIDVTVTTTDGSSLTAHFRVR